MKRSAQRVCYLLFSLTVLSLLDMSPVAAEESTLARLSFWVPPEQMEAFETTYRGKILPVLEQYMFAGSSPASPTISTALGEIPGAVFFCVC